MASDGVGHVGQLCQRVQHDSVLAQLIILPAIRYGYIHKWGFKKLQAKGWELDDGIIPHQLERQTDYPGGISTGTVMPLLSQQPSTQPCWPTSMPWYIYAHQAFYGLMGDGTYALPAVSFPSAVHILSHYAQHVTGKTRIECYGRRRQRCVDRLFFLPVIKRRHRRSGVL
jgi:hypothetical protein